MRKAQDSTLKRHKTFIDYKKFKLKGVGNSIPINIFIYIFLTSWGISNRRIDVTARYLRHNQHLSKKTEVFWLCLFSSICSSRIKSLQTSHLSEFFQFCYPRKISKPNRVAHAYTSSLLGRVRKAIHSRPVLPRHSQIIKKRVSLFSFLAHFNKKEFINVHF